jgi:integrase
MANGISHQDAMSTNRYSERKFQKRLPIHNGTDGFYIFVPADRTRVAAAHSQRIADEAVHPNLDGAVLTSNLSGRKKHEVPREIFEAVANEWFDVNCERWVDTYRTRLRSRLDDDLIAEMGAWYILEIEPLDVLSTIRKIEKRGAIESAKRILNMASSVFRYGVATGRCLRDPTSDIRGALRPPLAAKRRTALPAAELPEFMKKLSRYTGDPITRLGVRILILTFVRTGELRFAKWSEFEHLDGPGALWRIPAERMKLRRPHLVPLAPQAVSVLLELRKLTGKCAYLLPAPTKLGVISENTMLFALYRLGYHTRATVHGFRATASTVLNEAQFNRDWIELQLAHTDGSIRGVYNFAEWLPGRREMLTWWADFLDGNAKPRV